MGEPINTTVPEKTIQSDGMDTFKWENRRGKALHAVQYAPPKGVKPQGIVVLHHGFREHVGRFTMVAAPLAAAGYYVFMYDMQGHGLSEPTEGPDRFVVNNIQSMSTDFLDFCDDVVADLNKDLNLPIFAAGNSIGGQTVVISALRRPELFSGLLLFSPALDAEWNLMLRVLAVASSILNVVAPRAQMVGATPLEDVTYHEGDRNLIINDTLIPVGDFDVRTGHSFLQGFKYVAENEHKLDVPIAVLIGDEDKIVSASAAKRLLKNAATREATYIEVKGGWHMLVNGTDHADICFEHMKDWLSEQCAKIEAKAAAI